MSDGGVVADRFLLEDGSRFLLEDGSSLLLESSLPGGVQVRSSSTGTNIANPTTGVTVTKPSGVVDGDVLYAFVVKTEAGDTALFTCAGWTTILPGTPLTTTENDRHIAILRKVIMNASGEAASYTFVTTSTTASAMGAIIVAVTGADVVSGPEDRALTTSDRTFGVNDATPASQDFTTVTHNALVLSFCFLALGGSTAAKTWGVPSGYTNITSVSEMGSASNDLQIGVAYKAMPTAGAVGTNVWTHTADDATTDWVVAAVAVRVKPDGFSGGLLNAGSAARARMIR